MTFFKSRRSARDGLSIKNGKSSLNSLVSIENKEFVDSSVTEVESNKTEFCVPQVSLIDHKVTVKAKPARKIKAAARSKLSSKESKESIVAAFQRAALKKAESLQDQTVSELPDTGSQCRKRGRDADALSQEEDAEVTDVSALQLQNNTTPVKNQGLEEQSEQHQQKRHKLEQSSFCTPDSKSTSSTRATRGSARKKLQLEQEDAAAKENTQAATGAVKLRKCSKLSELRAQLLRVKECDSKLLQFRATVQQATHEAAAAAALVTKAKGGLPDAGAAGPPLKSASPLKAFASPRKDRASPYKVPASPYKVPASPYKVPASPYKVPASPCKAPASPRVPHPQLQHFRSLDVDVPVSPSKTPLKSPCKAPSSGGAAVPAYQRYQHLLHDQQPLLPAAAADSELTLPHHYRLLREVFRAVDTVVSLMHNRQEVVTYSKLRPAVQQMIRRTFYESNLGQLSRVFPLAYIFRQDKIRPGTAAITAAGTPNKSGYQLTVVANLDYKNGSSDSSSSSDRTARAPSTKVNLLSRFDGPSPAASTATSSSSTNKETTYRKMDSVVMVERRSLFHTALVQSVRHHHAQFLKSLEPSVEVSDYSTIRRWHPSFPLNEVPEIEPAQLPQPPHQQSYSNATDVLAAARGLFSANPRLEAAVERAAEEGSATVRQSPSAGDTVTGVSADAVTSGNTSKLQQTAATTTVAAQTPDVALALRGISSTLLARIRAREAAAASRAMVRSASDNNELAQLSRLPELARILRHTMVAERKAALHWDAALATLRESHAGMLSPGEMEEHLELLLKHVPAWIAKHKLSSGLFVKINKSTDINTVVDKLQAIVKQKT